MTQPSPRPGAPATANGYVLGADGHYRPAPADGRPGAAPTAGAAGGEGAAAEQPVLRRPRGADRAAPVPPARVQGTPPVGLTGPLRQLLGPVTGSLKVLARVAEGTEQSLKVDWPHCRAHGLCHEVVPEVIHLDEWGYPFFDDRPLAGDELGAVRKAVQVCPTLALRLVDAPKR